MKRKIKMQGADFYSWLLVFCFVSITCFRAFCDVFTDGRYKYILHIHVQAPICACVLYPHAYVYTVYTCVVI